MCSAQPLMIDVCGVGCRFCAGQAREPDDGYTSDQRRGKINTIEFGGLQGNIDSSELIMEEGLMD